MSHGGRALRRSQSFMPWRALAESAAVVFHAVATGRLGSGPNQTPMDRCLVAGVARGARKRSVNRADRRSTGKRNGKH